MKKNVSPHSIGHIATQKATLISGYTKEHVRQLCRHGKIPAFRNGRAWLIHEASLRSYVQENAPLHQGNRPKYKEWIAPPRPFPERLLAKMPILRNKHSLARLAALTVALVLVVGVYTLRVNHERTAEMTRPIHVVSNRVVEAARHLAVWVYGTGTDSIHNPQSLVTLGHNVYTTADSVFNAGVQAAVTRVPEAISDFFSGLLFGGE